MGSPGNRGGTKLFALVALLGLLVGACSKEIGTPEPMGTGGAPGTGGVPGTGGTRGTGGTPGTGGVRGTGGALGVGGAVGTGGAPGTGGARGTGGAAIDAGRDAGGDAAPPADAASDSGPRPDAAADGPPAYAPCPTDGSACIIMPLGDSITDGYPFENGGYRVELFHQAVQGRTPITFVGRNMNGPTTVDNMPFPRNHEGYSGYTIDSDASHNGISPLVEAGISAGKPHIILLHIGTNDVNGNVNLSGAPTRLGALIDRITAATPALLVVAQIIPTTTDSTNNAVRTYNAAIPALVQQRAAAGKHVMLIDMYSVFTARSDYKTALMNDNLHPNATGYAAMGDAWYAAIRSLLPTR
jgi:lysophospholipase L1-like esterase